jgi:hypothetical protein
MTEARNVQLERRQRPERRDGLLRIDIKDAGHRLALVRGDGIGGDQDPLGAEPYGELPDRMAGGRDQLRRNVSIEGVVGV